MYFENPKTKGSGVVCCIPQKGLCPMGCEDCFFQSGRSYLEPLDENLPNMPYLEDVGHRVVRVNDGNDSNVDRDLVMESTSHFPLRFYNTSIPNDLEKFVEPVVLTVNPQKMTDKSWHKLDPIPKNLMFVRIRVNTWNLDTVVAPATKYYTEHNVPVIFTYMAYYTESIPKGHEQFYQWKKRTLNSYWVLTEDYRRKLEDLFKDNPLVYSCGWKGTFVCTRCGNCLREFFVTKERIGT